MGGPQTLFNARNQPNDRIYRVDWRGEPFSIFGTSFIMPKVIVEMSDGEFHNTCGYFMNLLTLMHNEVWVEVELSYIKRSITSVVLFTMSQASVPNNNPKMPMKWKMNMYGVLQDMDLWVYNSGIPFRLWNMDGLGGLCSQHVYTDHPAGWFLITKKWVSYYAEFLRRYKTAFETNDFEALYSTVFCTSYSQYDLPDYEKWADIGYEGMIPYEKMEGAEEIFPRVLIARDLYGQRYSVSEAMLYAKTVTLTWTHNGKAREELFKVWAKDYFCPNYEVHMGIHTELLFTNPFIAFKCYMDDVFEPKIREVNGKVFATKDIAVSHRRDDNIFIAACRPRTDDVNEIWKAKRNRLIILTPAEKTARCDEIDIVNKWRDYGGAYPSFNITDDLSEDGMSEDSSYHSEQYDVHGRNVQDSSGSDEETDSGMDVDVAAADPPGRVTK
jgi:hypothetical protein